MPRTFVFDDLNFDSASTNLTPDSVNTLGDLVAIMKAFPSAQFRLDGHTDSTGDAGANKTLSQQRADAVKSRMVASGIDAARIATGGWGHGLRLNLLGLAIRTVGRQWLAGRNQLRLLLAGRRLRLRGGLFFFARCRCRSRGYRALGRDQPNQTLHWRPLSGQWAGRLSRLWNEAWCCRSPAGCGRRLRLHVWGGRGFFCIFIIFGSSFSSRRLGGHPNDCDAFGKAVDRHPALAELPDHRTLPAATAAGATHPFTSPGLDIPGDLIELDDFVGITPGLFVGLSREG